MPLPGDLVRLLPGTRYLRLAELYWRDGRRVEVVGVDGSVTWTRIDRVHVVAPRVER